MFGKKDNSAISLPRGKSVCGYEIKKMPIAPYLMAIERLTNLPEDFINICFPGKQPAEVLKALTTLDKNTLTELIAGAFIAAPKYIIDLVADLTGIDREAIINDEKIGLDGLIDIIDAFIEVNNLGKCLSGVVALKAKLTGLNKAI